MSNNSHKGSSFERWCCVTLSEWWSVGIGQEKRSDIFWRSSQSGGRATQRFKKGITTYGSYGDIAAVDPIGEPLLRFATIELKRGSTHGTPWDLLESAKTKVVRPFERALNQAKLSSEQAGSQGWILIARRDRKEAMIYIDSMLHTLLASHPFAVLYRLRINQEEDFPVLFKFAAMPLKDWLKAVTPEQIIKCEHK